MQEIQTLPLIYFSQLSLCSNIEPEKRGKFVKDEQCDGKPERCQYSTEGAIIMNPLALPSETETQRASSITCTYFLTIFT